MGRGVVCYPGGVGARAARRRTVIVLPARTGKAPSLNPPIPHFHFPQPVHHHMSAPEVEERAPHEYEGVGIGRRESLKGDDLPPAHHGEEAAGHATKERAQAPPPPQH